MKIPLNEFDQIIDETILKRGLNYFKKGAITDFTEISKDEYEAIISGTQDYTVQLAVNNSTIVEHNCDCPYDMGPVCKHIVALVFHLQQDYLDLDQPKKSIPKKRRTKSVSQQIKELLKVISHEELIDFVQENSKKDRKLRNLFLASFGHLSQNQSKEFYQKQIHSILQTAAGRHGWISWSDMKYVVSATHPFLENAEKYFNNKDYENVLFISTALLEEMTEALQYADDSSGELGNFIDIAFDLLSRISQEPISNNLKNQLFDYCITCFNQKLFEGWDWHLGILAIAIDLTETETQADIILKSLGTVNSIYEQEHAQSLKLELLRRFKDESVVEQFIGEHISNPTIRAKEIEIAFKNKNFERVINLSKEGIKCDENQKPGLVKNWYNWLLKVAQNKNDTDKIIEYAKWLLIDNFYPEQDYYQILKDSIEDKNWHPFLEELIKELRFKKKWAAPELIRKIYIKEEWWDRLYLLLQKSASLQNIEKNEHYLTKDYSSELVDLYTKKILEHVEYNMGRKHYKTACKYLRRMKKLGGNDKVIELIDFFRKQYPQRRALMDELNRV